MLAQAFFCHLIVQDLGVLDDRLRDFNRPVDKIGRVHDCTADGRDEGLEIGALCVVLTGSPDHETRNALSSEDVVLQPP